LIDWENYIIWNKNNAIVNFPLCKFLRWFYGLFFRTGLNSFPPPPTRFESLCVRSCNDIPHQLPQGEFHVLRTDCGAIQQSA
jgi:hypothetical protein